VTDALAARVAAFLGRADDAETLALAEVHVPVVCAFVKAYTRGRGFAEDGTPSDDVAAVIVTATARLLTNPSQGGRYQVGEISETPAVLNGFTLPEVAVLHLYRRRAA